MPVTYDNIATQTLVSTASSVVFSSIPSTYTDLVIVIDATTPSDVASILMSFNSDTGTNYSNINLSGNGSASSSAATANANSINVGVVNSGTQRGTTIISVMSYSNTTFFKTILSRSNIVSFAVRAIAGLYRSTSAINAITFTNSSGTFSANSTFTLYGIKAA
jgi:hypothetical protein